LIGVDYFKIIECRLRKHGVAAGVTKSVRYGFEQTIKCTKKLHDLCMRCTLGREETCRCFGAQEQFEKI
jgi:hypothetical protein